MIKDRVKNHRVLSMMLIPAIFLHIFAEIAFHSDFIYFQGIDFKYIYLLESNDMNAIFTLSPEFYYFVNALMLFLLALLFYKTKLRIFVLSFLIGFPLFFNLVSGLAVITPVMDFIGTLSGMLWGGIVFYFLRTHILKSCINSGIEESVFNDKLFLIVQFMLLCIISMLGVEMVVTLLQSLNNDGYSYLLVYSIQEGNKTIYYSNLVLLYFVFAGCFWKRKWGVIGLYATTSIFVLNSLFVDFHIYTPILSNIRFIIELLWGGLIFMVILLPQKLWR